jgi:hypothetical protein
MRRRFALFLSVTALGLLTPAVFGQYPYPYGPMPIQYGPMPGPYPPMPAQYAPMPAQYAPPYGYPPPMPAYGPNPMMAQPMYYQPAPMWQAPQSNNSKVVVYGPLTEEMPSAPLPSPLAAPAKSAAAPPAMVQSQAPAAPNRGGMRILPTTYSKTDLPPETYDPAYSEGPAACGSAACGPACDPHPPWDRPLYGRGHFIGEVGAYFLTPVSIPHTAFTSTIAGNTATTEFPRNVDFGATASFGYLWHNDWGFRGNYTYLRGTVNGSISNSDPTSTILTAVPVIMSPSLAVGQGIGSDQFTFAQHLELHVADIEVLKEAHFLDTTFLFSFGGRYAHVQQSYSASRNNPGGTNGVITVALDREDLDASNRFDGWGPTFSFEAVHPLTHWGLSGYGSVRGSVLWGIDRFRQNYHNGTTLIDANGVPIFTDVTKVGESNDRRTVPTGEAEVGLQFGNRIGRFYVFARAGAVFQRWWDVGSPYGSSGNLGFLGGTMKVGITY